MGNPLNPEIGGQSISDTDLYPGDIIVSTTMATISRAIRGATGSQVSHAMLYVGHGYVVEAVGGGVRRVKLEEAISDAILAVALRRRGLSANTANAVVSFVTSRVGLEYDILGIIGQAGYQLDQSFLCKVMRVRDCTTRAARYNLWMEDDDAFFCSELIAAAFEHVGFPLVHARPSAVSPHTVVEAVSSGRLDYVGHLRGP